MKKWLKAAPLILPIVVAGYLSAASGQDENTVRGFNPIILSIVSLIAKPEDFNNRYVKIVGFADFQKDGVGIYLHKDDYENGITINGVWIAQRFDEETKKSINHQYVLIEGFYKSSPSPPQGLWSGSIETVRRFQKWSKPSKSETS